MRAPRTPIACGDGANPTIWHVAVAISAADTVGGVVLFGQIAIDGTDLYWLEGRPSEAGRQVLVRRDRDGSGQRRDARTDLRPHQGP